MTRDHRLTPTAIRRPIGLTAAAVSLAFGAAASADTGDHVDSVGPRTVDLLGSEEFSGHAHAAWHSRYVSEGRDNLDGEGILATTVELGFRDLTGHWCLTATWSIHGTFTWTESIHRNPARHPGDSSLGSFGHVGIEIERTF